MSGARRWLAAVLAAALLVSVPASPAAADESTDRMRADVATLAATPREAGTAAERAALDFVAGRLGALGLPVSSQDVPLPNGRTSGNRWTSFGSGPVEVLLGAHIDTVRVSPGADDNASGSAILLELARRLDTGAVAVPPGTTVTLAWFGAEERLAGRPANDHHFGSRRMAADRVAIGLQPHWMLSVDMVGVGATPLAVWFDGTDPLAAHLLSAAAERAGQRANLSARGDISDHEAFGRRGTPAALLWRPDNPNYHGAGDTTVRDAALDHGLRTVEQFLRAVANPLTSSRGIVQQELVDLLARRPDLGGVGAATGRVDRGEAGYGRIGAEHLASSEWANVVAPVGRLYAAGLGRNADHAGLTFWTGRRRFGEPLEAAAAFFAVSPEFQARYGAPDDGGFVDLLYRNVLGRGPDPAGRAYWVGQLSCCRTRAQLLVQFSESGEHRQRTARTLPVTLAYAGLLRRGVDPAGLAFWISRSPEELVAALLASPEFRARFG